MSVDQALSRLEKILENSQVNFYNNLIMPYGQGYLAFGRFELSVKSAGVDVTEPGHDTVTFSNMRSAMSWCVSRKYNDYKLADEIRFLDEQCQTLSNDIVTSRLLLNRMRGSFARQNARAKLSHKKSRLDLLNNQIDKCARQAKYLQTKGFNDEIARTRRSASNKPNHSSSGIAAGVKTRN